MAELASRIRGAVEAVRLDHQSQSTQWASFYLSVGRALQAANAGDGAATHTWLAKASELEYNLVGNCNCIGGLLDELEGGNG